jgi:hypothetical protein
MNISGVIDHEKNKQKKEDNKNAQQKVRYCVLGRFIHSQDLLWV